MPIFNSYRLPASAESFFVATLATAAVAAVVALLATAFGNPEVAHTTRWGVSLVEVAAAIICMLYYYRGRDLCLLPALACLIIALPLVVSL